MVDIEQEKLIALRDVPKVLPPRQTGKRVHVSAVYRWVQRGVRGVPLESVRIGGTTYTSHEALQRFADQLGRPRHGPVQPTTTTASRQKQIERAEREVRAILGGKPAKKRCR